MSAANCSTTTSLQPVPKLVAHDDAAHLLDDLNPDRHLSNPCPPLSDHSPTPRGVTAPLDHNNASSIEQALSHLAVGSTEEALSPPSLDEATDTSSADDNADLVAPPNLLRVIDWMRSDGFPVPPKIEAMLQDSEAFDRNGECIMPPIALERITDHAKLLSILVQAEILQACMDYFIVHLKSPRFAAPASASDAAAAPVLTPAEISSRGRSWVWLSWCELVNGIPSRTW